jgi:hypothetical protein
MSETREFIDFWIENSVHAAEGCGAGGEQDVAELTRRFIEAAKGQGIAEADLRAEIGDIFSYVRQKLNAANKAENEQRRLGQ